MSSLKLEVRLFYKYGGVYREMIKVPNLDWCQLMKNDRKENAIVDQLVKFLKENVPDVIHECPYMVYNLKYYKVSFHLIFTCRVLTSENKT